MNTPKKSHPWLLPLVLFLVVAAFLGGVSVWSATLRKCDPDPCKDGNLCNKSWKAWEKPECGTGCGKTGDVCTTGTCTKADDADTWSCVNTDA